MGRPRNENRSQNQDEERRLCRTHLGWSVSILVRRKSVFGKKDVLNNCDITYENKLNVLNDETLQSD